MSDKVIAWSGGVLLLILHLDFWRPQRVALYGGWLPEELLYRLVWMLLAWLYLMYFCARIWRSKADEQVGESESRSIRAELAGSPIYLVP